MILTANLVLEREDIPRNFYYFITIRYLVKRAYHNKA